MPVIETKGLVKHYKKVQALKGVSLAVEKGEIFGLLGRNGAGKTTFVKVLLGMVHRTAGDANLMGRPVGDPASRFKVGYLPEDHRLPDYHTAETALDVYGAMSGMSSADRKALIPPMIERVGLKDAAMRKVRTYSKGMKQRLGLAQAMLHDPEVLFLDEPTDGVDPVGRKEIREVLLGLKERGRTIFLNSHLLGEVELLCDRVAIVESGLLIREGGVAELTTVRDVYELSFDGPIDGMIPEIEKRVRGLRRTATGLELDVDTQAALDAVVDLIRSKGIGIASMGRKKQTLEDIFIQSLGKPPEGKGAGA